MPNVFSPNGDQINDTFCAYSPCIAEAQMWIYDRWGNLVFQSNPTETQPCWDGSSRGQAMDTGMYYYRLRGVDVLGKAVDLQGSVSLLR
jgi:gliding motility-associated-like protein